MFLLFLLHVSCAYSKSSIIILYGCSSAGKTSISKELGKALPGKWKVLGIDMFAYSRSSGVAPTNAALWRQVNTYIDEGYNVVVDTISPNFIYNRSKAQEFVVITYCSPSVLLDHIAKRNQSENSREHRSIKNVLTMYCHKYKITLNKEESVDVLHKSDLEHQGFSKRGLRRVKKEFFSGDHRTKVYVASRLSQYNCRVDTSKMSVSACVKKIQQEFVALAVG